MAMQKDIELPSGVKTTYHRIEQIEARFPNTGNPVVQVVVGSYLDQAARAAGKAAVRVTSHAMEVTGDVTREAVYVALSEPIRMEPREVPGSVQDADGKWIPGFVTVDQQVGTDTGYNGATEV